MIRRGIVIRVDDSTDLVDLGDDNSTIAHDIIGDYFDVTMLTTHFDPGKYSLGIAVDDRGLLKDLPPNILATRLRGCFVMQKTPLVGTAIVIAANGHGEGIDIPEDVIQLVDAIRKVW